MGSEMSQTVKWKLLKVIDRYDYVSVFLPSILHEELLDILRLKTFVFLLAWMVGSLLTRRQLHGWMKQTYCRTLFWSWGKGRPCVYCYALPSVKPEKTEREVDKHAEGTTMFVHPTSNTSILHYFAMDVFSCFISFFWCNHLTTEGSFQYTFHHFP